MSTAYTYVVEYNDDQEFSISYVESCLRCAVISSYGGDFIMELHRTISNREKEIAQLKAENEKLKAEREWRPIESAPKDGTVIVIYSDVAHVGYWDLFKNRWYYDGLASPIFTHWMPLPTCPQET